MPLQTLHICPAASQAATALDHGRRRRKEEVQERRNETPEERAARKALKKQKLLTPKPRSDSFSKPAQLPAPERAENSETSFAAFAKEHAVELSGSEPVPVVAFDKSPFNAACKQKLAKEGFAKPTPTQSVSWPLALTGTDLISIAKTGSGKTLGFLPVSYTHLTLPTICSV